MSLLVTMLLTSCNILNYLPKESSEDSSSNESSSSESTSSESSSKDLSKYEDWKDYEWFNIGFEYYTDYLGNNIYFDSLIRYETFKSGKYLCDDEYWGHFNLFVCENGDVGYDPLTKMVMFDKSEYTYYTLNINDYSYTESAYRENKTDKMFAFYLELSSVFFSLNEDVLSFNELELQTLQAVYSFYGIVLQFMNEGTVEQDETSAYICNGAYGLDATYNDSYLFTTYMNCNPLFKYSGLPPFLSESHVDNWEYKRGYTKIRGKRCWSDVSLIVWFKGYTAEEVRSWIPLFSMAGYQQTNYMDKLDDETNPLLDYEASIDILGFTYNSQPTSYLKNRIELYFTPIKWDKDYHPIDYSVMYKITFCQPTVWDIAGKFVFQDDGLHFYYTDQGAALEAKIVNLNREIETANIVKDKGDTHLSFYFPHELINDE